MGVADGSRRQLPFQHIRIYSLNILGLEGRETFRSQLRPDVDRQPLFIILGGALGDLDLHQVKPPIEVLIEGQSRRSDDCAGVSFTQEGAQLLLGLRSRPLDYLCRIEFLARGVCAEVDGDEPLVVATLFDLAGATRLGLLYTGLLTGLPGFGGLNFLTALGGIIQKAPLAPLAV